MNTCANLFHSESELRAALGSASKLDRKKQPRRWAQAQARLKVVRANDPVDESPDDGRDVGYAWRIGRARFAEKMAERRAGIRAQMEKLTHLPLRQASAEIGLSYDAGRRYAAMFGLRFAQ